MIAMRRLIGGAAVLTCVALLGGIRPTAVAQNTSRIPAAAQPGGDEKTSTAVDRIAAAGTMIEYGIENNKPLAILAGVEILWDTPSSDRPADAKNEITVEGAASKAIPAEKERLLQLVSVAKKMAAGNEAYLTVAKQLEQRLNGARGTPNGPWKKEFIVDPTNKSTDKPVVVVKKTFISGQVGKITVTKEFNENIPLSYKVFDGSGNQVDSRPGHGNQFEFRVPKGKDQVYRLEIRNYHSKGVQIRVDTN